MAKWLIILLALAVVYYLFRNDFRHKKSGSEKKEKERMAERVASGEMVKDPACGAYVSIDGSISVRDGDKVHHFCSYDCRERFLRQLEKEGRELPASPTSKDDE